MRWAPICCAPSTTSSSRTAPTCARCWTRGRYDEAQLSNVYTGNDARARIVLKQLRDKVADVGAMRALGFCVSVAHAEYMARRLHEAGIPARAVSGRPHDTNASRRSRTCATREVNILFAADLFNEGLDVPDVDTVLFLRPTESATIFLQQLGRGLRRTRDKAVLTVLDFVGYHRKEFRFDRKLRALTGDTRPDWSAQVEEGFPFLPSGCQIVLDKQSQAIVLENIRSQIANRWPQIVAELRSYGDQTLATFLEESGIELTDILRRGSHSWTRLRRDAGLPTAPGSTLEEKLLKRVRAFAHVDDPDRAAALPTTPRRRRPDVRRAVRRRAAPGADALLLTLVRRRWPRLVSRQGSRHCAKRRPRGAEIASVVDISFEAARHVTVDLAGELGDVPLRFTPDISAKRSSRPSTSLGSRTAFARASGTPHELNVDAFFVTLRKSEADYSPTTMYRDYPIARPVPLGVAVDDLRRVTDRPALPLRLEHRVDLRSPRTEG